MFMAARLLFQKGAPKRRKLAPQQCSDLCIHVVTDAFRQNILFMFVLQQSKLYMFKHTEQVTVV